MATAAFSKVNKRCGFGRALTTLNSACSEVFAFFHLDWVDICGEKAGRSQKATCFQKQANACEISPPAYI